MLLQVDGRIERRDSSGVVPIHAVGYTESWRVVAKQVLDLGASTALKTIQTISGNGSARFLAIQADRPFKLQLNSGGTSTYVLRSDGIFLGTINSSTLTLRNVVASNRGNIVRLIVAHSGTVL